MMLPPAHDMGHGWKANCGLEPRKGVEQAAAHAMLKFS